ncbi:MAG: hypothetical protein ACPGVO_17450 [Spirulinaceae cyanobacterium]
MNPTLSFDALLQIIQALTLDQKRQLQEYLEQQIFEADEATQPETTTSNINSLPQPQNGLELLAYWKQIGVINSLPKTVDSQEYARQLRHQAQTRNLAQF